MVTAIRNTSAWPLVLQFACTLMAIIGVFLIQFPLEEKGFGVPFALFLACVFMVALMFGRRSGFLSVALSAPLCTVFFAPWVHSWAAPRNAERCRLDAGRQKRFPRL